MPPQTIHPSRTPAYSRRYDALRRNHDYRALVDGTVTRRKIAALYAIGYSLTDIGKRIGRTQQSVSDTLLGSAPVHWKTERAIARVYDELHLSTPEGHYPHRTRLRAQRLGYAAPAAWDDIESIKERPKGVLRT